MSRIVRDKKGRYLPSDAPKEYGGTLVCKVCELEKDCTSENFRLNSGNGPDKIRVALTCRKCQYEKSKARHIENKKCPNYLAKRRELGKSWRKRNRPVVLFKNYSGIDLKKGMEFNLTVEEITELISFPCFYCGYQGDLGLDRIDNKLGHTKDNVKPCCSQCNMARSDFFTVEEMRDYIGPAIAEVRKLREVK